MRRSRAVENFARPVLAVADLPGHILERIGKGWAEHGKGVRHEVITSPGLSNYALCRRAEKTGVVHWIDSPRFVKCGHAVRCPQVLMVHHVNPDMGALYKSRLQFADAVTTGSRYWQNRIAAETGREVRLIPYTLDTDHFRPSLEREFLRKQAGILPAEFALGFVAKAVADEGDRKGTGLLMKILEAAGREFRGLVLVISGSGWDQMAEEIRRYGIKVLRYEFKSTEETVDAYALMDCLLVTSVVEGGPCIVLEAMACGVPVISSVVGHVPEVIKDGETGFLCPQREVGEYLRALKFLRERPEQAEAIKRAARELMVASRDTKTETPKIDFKSLYQEAVARYQRRSLAEYLDRSRTLAGFYVRHLRGKK